MEGARTKDGHMAYGNDSLGTIIMEWATIPFQKINKWINNLKSRRGFHRKPSLAWICE